MLSAEERATYRRDGQVTPANHRVPDDVLARLRRAADELIAAT